MGGTRGWWVFGCRKDEGRKGLAGAEGALLPSTDRTGRCPCGCVPSSTNRVPEEHGQSCHLERDLGPENSLESSRPMTMTRNHVVGVDSQTT